MKKIIISIGLVIFCAFLLVGCAKDKIITEAFPKRIQELESYVLKGRLESFFPTGRKESEVTVSYKQPDYYRVELKMLGLNESQLIVKNKDGVYVLIPRINKTFRIEGSWPLNSSCSYLLQSLAKDIVNDPDIRIIEDKDSYTVEVKAKLFHDANPTKQKIIFDKKTKLPGEVLVYDDNQNLMSRLTINTIDINPKISDDVFKVDKTIEEIRQEYGGESPTYEDRAFVYPTYFPEGSSLDQEVITGEDEDRLAIMKFKGEEISYTVIQQYVNDQEAVSVTEKVGEILLVSGNIAIFGNDQLVFLENGIEYIIASTTVDFTEIYKMAESMVADTEK